MCFFNDQVFICKAPKMTTDFTPEEYYYETFYFDNLLNIILQPLFQRNAGRADIDLDPLKAPPV